jgi:DNA-directed RNA polymerase specialized sigma24 family protein
MLDHWCCWTAACALGLCPPDTRAALQQFVAVRFRRHLEVYAHRTAVDRPDALMPTPADAWQVFETWLRLRNTREGKTYKQWLLAHAAGVVPWDQQRVESAATLLVRDAVREYLRREVAPACMVSLDRATGPDGVPGNVSLHELLPDPSPARADAESRDLDRLAADEAGRAMQALPQRERVALLARALGLALSHPYVVQTAGCGKSTLSTAYADALQGIALHVQVRFPGEDRSTQADLAIRLFAALQAQLADWGRGDPACASFFLRAETERCMPLSGAA